MKKYINYIIVIIIGISLITVGIFMRSSKDNEKSNSEPNKVENTKEPENEKKYESLYDIADELYETNEYLNLTKNVNETHYILKYSDYKKRGYPLELVESSCQDDNILIFFELGSKENTEEPKYFIANSCAGIDNETLDSNTSLFGVAKELYNSDAYKQFPQDEKGVYYLTIGEYKKRGYNISFIDSTCADNFGIIYFDIENKDKYLLYPVYILEECTKKEKW